MHNQNLKHEIAFFFSLPLLVSVCYVWFFHKPAIAIIEHLYSLSLVFISLICLKILFNNLITNKKTSYVLSVNLYATVIFFYSIYVSLVFIGLNAWGRVVTEEFIVSYIKQARNFSQVLGISFEVIITTIVFYYLIIAFICHLFLSKFNWLPKYKCISNYVFNLFIFSLLLFFTYWFDDYLQSDHGNSKELFYLTASTGKSKSQNHNANLGNTVNKPLSAAPMQANLH